MNAANDVTVLVDELAGQWTESGLEILKAAGLGPISVDMEVEAWRTLKDVLSAELRWQRSFWYAPLVPLRQVMQQTLRKALLLVAQKFMSGSASFEFEKRVGQLALARRSSVAEQRLYVAIVNHGPGAASFKERGRSGFVPRLRVSVGGGSR